jgi:transcriptional regulatory protein RtcR
MATLAPGGRIRETEVDAEIARLTASWGTQSPEPADRGDVVREVLGPAAAELDRFDRVQLADVIGVCRTQPSLSEAGRALFGQSRRRKASRNDADRLRKYLARFGLTFDGLAAAADGSMRGNSGDAADRLERTANFAFDAAGRRA